MFLARKKSNPEHISSFKWESTDELFVYGVGIQNSEDWDIIDTIDMDLNLIKLLEHCKLQLEYLNEKFGETGTSNALISKLESYIKK